MAEVLTVEVAEAQYLALAEAARQAEAEARQALAEVRQASAEVRQASARVAIAELNFKDVNDQDPHELLLRRQEEARQFWAAMQPEDIEMLDNFELLPFHDF